MRLKTISWNGLESNDVIETWILRSRCRANSNSYTHDHDTEIARDKCDDYIC